MSEQDQGYVVLSHDGQARREFIRMQHPRGVCRWCGTERARLYSYGWLDDDKPTARAYYATLGCFCGVACYRAFVG